MHVNYNASGGLVQQYVTEAACWILLFNLLESKKTTNGFALAVIWVQSPLAPLLSLCSTGQVQQGNASVADPRECWITGG